MKHKKTLYLSLGRTQKNNNSDLSTNYKIKIPTTIIKLLLLIFFLSITFYNSYSQKGHSLGLNITPQATFLSENSNLNLERKIPLKFAGGISGGYKLKRFKINYGVYYSNQGQNFISHYDFRDKVELQIRLNYLKFPFTVDYEFLKKDKVSFNFLLGFNMAFLLNSSDNFEDTYLETILLSKTKYNKIYINSKTGVGLRYYISENITMNIKSYFEYGLMNIFEKNNNVRPRENEWVDFDFSRNIISGISLGFTYYLKGLKN